ncbi:MAG TPA: prenyltransferase [Planctomycetes bacterium]|nr:prenyltransferase [Planctomycetota bacterium]
MRENRISRYEKGKKMNSSGTWALPFPRRYLSRKNGAFLLLPGLGTALALFFFLPSASAQKTKAATQGTTVSSIGGGNWEVTREIQEATDAGLAYLAKTQNPEGYWAGHVGYKINNSYQPTMRGAAHVGVTALAAMAFMACGELPQKGKYGKVVAKAIDFLAAHTEENGYITLNGTRMYSHAFATLALAEVYGMTRDRRVHKALQRSIDLIVQSQNREGGWRYKPFAQQSDMSITVCQVMALRAARNAGIRVPKSVIEKAVRYVRSSARQPRSFRGRRRFSPRFGNGVFAYQRRAEARATFPLTAAGVTILYGAGVYNDPLISRGLDYMSSEVRRFNNRWAGHYFFFYGNYYAVQAFFFAGGRRWKKYFDSVQRLLRSLQEPNGSWACDIGPGSNFGTAVATLILAIPYRYLPIIQR